MERNTGAYHMWKTLVSKALLSGEVTLMNSGPAQIKNCYLNFNNLSLLRCNVLEECFNKVYDCKDSILHNHENSFATITVALEPLKYLLAEERHLSWEPDFCQKQLKNIFSIRMTQRKEYFVIVFVHQCVWSIVFGVKWTRLHVLKTFPPNVTV